MMANPVATAEYEPDLALETIPSDESRLSSALAIGHSALELAGSAVTYIGEKAKDAYGAVVDNLTPVIASTAIAIGGVAITETSTATGKISPGAKISEKVLPKNKVSKSSTNTSTIRFYSASDKRPYKMLEKKIKTDDCFLTDKALQVNPDANINRPDGRVHNKIARAWIDYPVKNGTQRARTELKPHKTLCFAFVYTWNGKVYFVERKNFKFKKNHHTNLTTATYTDPFKKTGEPSPAIRTISFLYRNKK